MTCREVCRRTFFFMLVPCIFVLSPLLTSSTCFHSSEFDEVAKALGWPFVTTAIAMPPPASTQTELRNRLATLFGQLLKLQLPYPLLQTSLVNGNGGIARLHYGFLTQKIDFRPPYYN